MRSVSRTLSPNPGLSIGRVDLQNSPSVCEVKHNRSLRSKRPYSPVDRRIRRAVDLAHPQQDVGIQKRSAASGISHGPDTGTLECASSGNDGISCENCPISRRVFSNWSWFSLFAGGNTDISINLAAYDVSPLPWAAACRARSARTSADVSERMNHA
jgi:hypothetical protein